MSKPGKDLTFARVGAISFLVPLLFFLTLVLIIPLGQVILTSVHEAGAWSLETYARFSQDRLFRHVLANTLSISVTAALVTVVFGYIVALHLFSVGPRKRPIYIVLILIPFWTSILVKSYAFTILLGTHGVVNNAIQHIVGSEFVIPLIFNRIGVIIGLFHWLLPFAVFPILSNLLAQDQNLGLAARVMGASNAYIFWRITLPLSLPGVLTAGLTSVLLSMGSFVTPALLGGRGDMMMANLVDFYIREALDWRMASTISVMLLLVAAVLLVGGNLIAKRASTPEHQ